MFRSFALLSICLAILATAGCRGEKGPRTVPAKGTITLDGSPIGGAAIVFTTDTGATSAFALSEDDGSFSLDAFEYKSGAIPGEYKAIVTRTVEVTTASGDAPKGEEKEHAEEGGEAGQQLGVKNDLPPQYGIPSDDFKFTIPEDGILDLKLELVSD